MLCMAKRVVTTQKFIAYHIPSGSYSRNDRTFGIMSELSDNHITMYKIANSLHISAQLFMVGGFLVRGDAFLCYWDTKTL